MLGPDNEWEVFTEKAASELSAGLGVAARLEEIWKAFDDAVDWGQDCMGYALQGWDWKYGDYWRKQEAEAIAAKRELKNIIIELQRPRFEGGGTCLEDCDA